MKTRLALLIFASVVGACGDGGLFGESDAPVARRLRKSSDAGTDTANNGEVGSTPSGSAGGGNGAGGGSSAPGSSPTNGGGATPTREDGGVALPGNSGGSTPQEAGQGPAIPPAGPPTPAIASNVTISEISINQAVKIPLMKGGVKVASRNAPVVANRPALVRVAVTRDAGYKGQSVKAELHLKGNGAEKIYTDTKVVPAAVVEGTLASTYNFEVPADAMPVGVQMSVALLDPAPNIPRAAYPKICKRKARVRNSKLSLCRSATTPTARDACRTRVRSSSRFTGLRFTKCTRPRKWM
jgi:hypothetical protein